MKPLLKIMNLKGLNIHQTLCFEEILLRRTKENWFLYNSGSSSSIRSIVVGFSGKIPALLHLDRVVDEGESVNIIRRYTGGGTVVVDKDTIFTTFIMNVSIFMKLNHRE